jgi:hypothetical protein
MKFISLRKSEISKYILLIIVIIFFGVLCGNYFFRSGREGMITGNSTGLIPLITSDFFKPNGSIIPQKAPAPSVTVSQPGASTVSQPGTSTGVPITNLQQFSNGLNNTVGAVGTVLSKTLDTAGNIVTKTVGEGGKIITTTTDAAGKVLSTVVTNAGNLASGTVGAAGNVASSAVNTAGNLVTNTASGITNTAKSLGSDASELLTSAASGAGDLAKGLLDGTTDTLKSIGGDLKDLANTNGKYLLDKNGNPMYGSNNIMQNGVLVNGNPVMGSVTGQPIDVYSYYGALPAKTSSDFKARGADFSNFDKFA